MPTISLVFDARAAEQGAQQYEQASSRIQQAARRTAREIQQLDRLQRRGGAQGAAQQTQAQVTQINRVTQAKRQEQQVERQLAADRARAARQQTRADAERLRTQRQAERGLARLLSLQGGAFRAIAQRTQQEQLLNQAVKQGLVTEQARAAIQASIIRNTTTQAVNSRDLRRNMLGLNQSVSQLSRSFSVLTFGPLSGVGARMATGQAATDELKRSIGTAGVGTAARVGLIGAVAGLAAGFAALGGSILLGRRIVRTALEFERIESTLRAATGSSEAAGRSFSFVQEQAERLGLSLTESAQQFASLEAAARGTSLSGRAVREIFIGIAEAGTVLGLSSEQVGGALTAIQQVISKGTVQAEELRGQLGERLPGAFQLAARSMDVTTAELSRMLERGEVLAEDLLPALAIELQRTFGPEAERASRNLRAELNRLETATDQLFRTLGEEGFIDSFTGAIQEITDSLKDPAFQGGLQAFATLMGETLEFMVENSGVILTVAGALGGLAVAGPQGAVAGGVAAAAGIGIAREVSAAERVEEALTRASEAVQDIRGAGDIPSLGAALGIGQDALDNLERAIELQRQRVETVSGQAGAPGTGFDQGARQERERLEDLIEAQERLRLALESTGITAEQISGVLSGTFGAGASQADRAERAFDKLRLEVDEALKAEEEYAQAQQIVSRAISLRVVSQEEGNRILDLAREATIGSTDAIKEEQKALEDAEKAQARYNDEIRKLQLRQDEDLAKSNERIASIERENESLEKQISVVGQGEQAVAAFAAQLRVEEEVARRVRDVGGPISPEELERIERAVLVNERLKDSLSEAQKLAKEQERAFTQPFENAAENIQRTFGDVFTDIFRGGVESFEDLGDAVLDIMARLAGEVATLLVFQPVLSGIAGGNTGGGILGALFGGGPQLSPVTGLSADASREAVLEWARAAEEGTAAGAEAGTAEGLKSISLSLGELLFGNPEKAGFASSPLFGGLDIAGSGGLLGTLGAAIGPGLLGFGLTSALGANALQSAGVGVIASTLIGPGLGAVLGPALGALGTALGGTVASSVLGAIGSAFSSTGVGAIIGLPLIAAGSVPNAVNIAEAGPHQFAGQSVSRSIFEAGTATFSPSVAIAAGFAAQFSKLPTSSFGFSNVAAGTADTRSDLAQRLAPGIESPFGELRLQFQSNRLESAGQDFLRTLADLDEQIARTLTDSEIAKVAADLQGLGLQGLRERRPEAVSLRFRGLTFERVASIVESLEGAGAREAFASAFPLGHATGGRLAAPVGRDLARRVNEFFNAREQVGRALRTLAGDEIPQLEDTLRRLQGEFFKAKGQAEEFGLAFDLSLDQVEQAAKERFGEDLARQVLAFTDPLAARLAEEAIEAERLLASARIAGAQAVADAEELIALRRQEIIERATEQANAPLTALLQEIRGGDIGGRSLAGRRAEAQDRFEEARAAAFGDPTDTGARADFAEAARTLLELNREQFASSAAFFESARFIEQSLENLRDLPISGADLSLPEGASTASLQEAQLSATQETNSTLTRVLVELEDIREENRELRETVAAQNTQIDRLLARVA